MRIKFAISITIIVFGCLIIFLASGFKLLDLSDLEMTIVKKNTGKVLGASEALEALTEKSVFKDGNKLPENIMAAKTDKIIEPKIIAGSDNYELSSGAGVVIDEATDKILFAQKAEEQMPIASISKLATTLVFLDYNPGWDEIYKVKASDITRGGRVYLSPGDKIRIKDLFNLSLVCSSNSAAVALVSASGLSQKEFVALMNKKAKDFGLSGVQFMEPTGLSGYNLASPRELAIFVKHALADKNISQASLLRKYSFNTLAGKNITVYNTDSLLDIFPQNGIKILGGKTGFTNLAGYCFTAKFVDKNGHELISVILANSSRKNSFSETKNMINWVYENYRWGE